MIEHLSISQLNLHRKNPRRYCLEYFEKIKLPPTPQLLFGTQVHWYLEHYIGPCDYPFNRQSELSTDNKFILEAAFCNQRNCHKGQDWRLEEEFRIFIDPELPPFKGAIDRWKYNPVECIVRVRDYKTTTPGYEETEESLLDNWQLNLYAYVLSGMLPVGTDIEIEVGHDQIFKTKDLKITDVKFISNKLTQKHMHDIIKEIKEEAFEVLETYKLYKQGGLEAIRETPENRWWYGKPCPYWKCIKGEESIEDLRKRIDELNR